MVPASTAFAPKVARGKAALAYPTVLAKFAIRQVREGRRVGSKRNVLDVMSSFGQRRKGFFVQQFPETTKHSKWEELVVEDRHAVPPKSPDSKSTSLTG